MKIKNQQQNRYIIDNKLVLATSFKEALAKYMLKWGSSGVAICGVRG